MTSNLIIIIIIINNKIKTIIIINNIPKRKAKSSNNKMTKTNKTSITTREYTLTTMLDKNFRTHKQEPILNTTICAGG